MLLPSCRAKWKFQMMTLSLLHRKELSKFCSSRGEVVPGLGTSWILEWCYCAFKFQHLRSSCSSCSFSPVGWGAGRAGKAWIVGPAVTELCVLLALDSRGLCGASCQCWECLCSSCSSAGLLSARKSQAQCLYCRRLRSVREEGNGSNSTPKLDILIYMAYILKILGKRYWQYGWRWETP